MEGEGLGGPRGGPGLGALPGEPDRSAAESSPEEPPGASFSRGWPCPGRSVRAGGRAARPRSPGVFARAQGARWVPPQPRPGEGGSLRPWMWGFRCLGRSSRVSPGSEGLAWRPRQDFLCGVRDGPPGEAVRSRGPSRGPVLAGRGSPEAPRESAPERPSAALRPSSSRPHVGDPGCWGGFGERSAGLRSGAERSPW